MQMVENTCPIKLSDRCDQMQFANSLTICTFAILLTRCISLSMWQNLGYFRDWCDQMYFRIRLVAQSSWFAMSSTGGIVDLLNHEHYSWFLAFTKRRILLAKKQIFSDRAQTFFGRVSSNFPTFFFFWPVFFFLLLLLFRMTFRTYGDYLLRNRTRCKKTNNICWE